MRIGVEFLLNLQHYKKEVSNWRLRPASPQGTQLLSTGQEKDWPPLVRIWKQWRKYEISSPPRIEPDCLDIQPYPK